MWLINAKTHKLECFEGSKIPKYAILSHTWGSREVSFQMMTNSSAQPEKGYAKIRKTCTQALRHGLQYAWVDTCCIDKTSSAELTESINSMFQWYRNAEKCYVFLSDLRSGVPAGDGLAACRWFTRGWTLQELIAPREIRFYNQEWKYIGHRKNFSKQIELITGINEDVLLGKAQLEWYSIATRMSWAAHRKTTRTEDLAYCLLGIFDVNMPLIYGEGLKAFRRLQEEIIKRSNDMTVFAWNHQYEQEQGTLYGLFSPSPAGFAESNGIIRYSRSLFDSVFTMTNKGLRIENFKFFYKTSVKDDDKGSETMMYSIPLGYRQRMNEEIDFSMRLRKVGPDVFRRVGKLRQEFSFSEQQTMFNFFIYADYDDSYVFEIERRDGALHFPKHDLVQIQKVIPESHWDETRRIFLPLEDSGFVLAASCAVKLGTSHVQVVAYVDFSINFPRCRVFNVEEYKSQSSWLFRRKILGHDVTWDDVEADEPELLDCTDKIEVLADGKRFAIAVQLDKQVVESISVNEIYSLNFILNEYEDYRSFNRGALQLPNENYENEGTIISRHMATSLNFNDRLGDYSGRTNDNVLSNDGRSRWDN